MKIPIRYRLRRKGQGAIGEIEVDLPDREYRDEDQRVDAIDDLVVEKLGESPIWWRETK